MENHPIPQDVTGFKFKLIGSVTLKQFLYLVGGGILAAVCFMLPISGIIKYPLSFLFGAVGSALAFLPIDGRPMDVMMKNFLKALPSENQYIFKKRGAEALITEFFVTQQINVAVAKPTQSLQNNTLDQKRALLFRTLKQSYRPDEKEEAILSNINNYLNEADGTPTAFVQNTMPQPVDKIEDIKVVIPTQITQPLDITKEVKVVLPATPLAVETPSAKPAPSIQSVEKLQPQIKMPQVKPQEEIQSPRVSVTPIEQIPTTPSPITSTSVKQQPSIQPNETQSVVTVAPEASLKAGFPQLPDTPNIVMGIIKDPRGRVLPNVLVEIMDTQGIPVRAFKTNALGQFAAATPLPDGEYNVLLEDPRKQNEFEQIHIVLSSEIFQPLEIISVDQREKLRRELFGAGTVGAQITSA